MDTQMYRAGPLLVRSDFFPADAMYSLWEMWGAGALDIPATNLTGEFCNSAPYRPP
jgi:hypothetical protein